MAVRTWRRGATGQEIDSEPLGGAHLHTAISGVAHYTAKNDADCIERMRQRVRQLPSAAGPPPCASAGGEPACNAAELYGVLPADHRLPYELEDIIEFQPEYVPEMYAPMPACAVARVRSSPTAEDSSRPKVASVSAPSSMPKAREK